MLAPDDIDDLGGLQRIYEHYGACQKRRNENAQHLPENMAQRQQIQEAQGMEETLVPQIFLDFVLDGFDIGQHVAVRDHYATRLGGRSGSEDYFQGVTARK